MNNQINILVIDDIEAIGCQISERIKPFCKTVNFYRYDVDKEFQENANSIKNIITDKSINYLVIDRGFYKIIYTKENIQELNLEEGYLYSCQSEECKAKKINADKLLLDDQDGLLKYFKNNSQSLNLKGLILYTFDPFDKRIKEKLENVKTNITNQGVSKDLVFVIETSEVFIKPTNRQLYKSFLAHPNEIDNNISHNGYQKIGFKSVFVEYGDLIGNIVCNIVNHKNIVLYPDAVGSYLNKNNLEFISYNRLLNEIYFRDDLKFIIGSVAAFEIAGIPDYQIDIPYKDYYDCLNIKLKEEDLQEQLFKDSEGEFLENQWIYYQYIYDECEKKFTILKKEKSGGISTNYIVKKWLPYLHSSVFYDKDAWQANEDKITEDSSNNSWINLYLFFTKIKFGGFEGHINFTFWGENICFEDNRIEQIAKRIYDEIYPLIKAKAGEILIPDLRDLIQQNARKSAFAEVNARTSSHNTGSHILANDLSSETKDNLAKFQTYLRQRMLFNSDITSGITSSEMDYSLNYIIKEFQSLKIVKKYISGITDCKFEEFEYNSEDLKRRISIPNGVLGLQALYVIFENIIRNYFKHASGDNSKLNINIKYDEESDDHICIALTDNTKPNEDQFKRIKTFVEAPILDNYKLRTEGMGFLEMRGAACYLNKIPIDQIDTYEIKITKNRKKEIKKVFGVKNKNGKLIFKLWLRKPKTVLIFTKEEVQNESNLKIKGIYINSDFSNIQNERHQWVVLDNQKNVENITQNQTAVSFKIFIVNGNGEDYPSLTKESYEKIFDEETNINELLYREWTEFIRKKKKENDKCYEIFRDDKIISVDDCKYVLFKREGTNCSKIVFDCHGQKKEDYSIGSNGVIYYEPYPSSVGTGTVIRHIDTFSDEQRKFFKYELFELAKMKIGILDERIQRKINDKIVFRANNKNIEFQVKEVFKSMGIFIPNHKNGEVNLNTKEFNNLIKQKISNWVKNYNHQLDYLIIHLGIIEKFLVDKKEPYIRKWICENISPFLENNYGTQIIVTTERGTPNNIPAMCRFVHYSNLVKYLFEDRSKYHLIKVLANSRKVETQ